MLSNGQFRVNGYTFGCGLDVDVLEFTTGGRKYRVQDQPNPVDDVILFGRDYLSPEAMTLKVRVRGQDQAETIANYNRFMSAWETAKRTTPGTMTLLEYGIAGMERRLWGRCGDTEFQEDTLFNQPRVVGTVNFRRSGNLVYDNAGQSLHLTLIPGEAGGIIFPLPFPWTSTSTGPRQGICEVEGLQPASVKVTFHGPVYAPKLTGPGWNISFPNLTLAYDQSVTIDCAAKTVLRQDGANLSAQLSRYTYLQDCVLNPGSREVVFSGTDNTGQAYCDVSWYPCYSGI